MESVIGLVVVCVETSMGLNPGSNIQFGIRM